MPDGLAFDQEDDHFRDIRGMVADSFQLSSN
jgi:hypothetical protein